jgi:hypothetical protein
MPTKKASTQARINASKMLNLNRDPFDKRVEKDTLNQRLYGGFVYRKTKNRAWDKMGLGDEYDERYDERDELFSRGGGTREGMGRFFYNVKGATLTIVGSGLFPDVYTLPYNNLNFSFNKSFGKDEKFKL